MQYVKDYVKEVNMNFTDRIIIGNEYVEEYVKKMNEGNPESRQKVKAFIQKYAPGKLDFNADSLFEAVKED